MFSVNTAGDPTGVTSGPTRCDGQRRIVDLLAARLSRDRVRPRLPRAGTRSGREVEDRRAVHQVLLHVDAEHVADVVVGERVAGRAGARGRRRALALVGEVHLRGRTRPRRRCPTTLNSKLVRELGVREHLDAPGRGAASARRSTLYEYSAPALNERLRSSGATRLSESFRARCASQFSRAALKRSAVGGAQPRQLRELRDDRVADVPVGVGVGRLHLVHAERDLDRRHDLAALHPDHVRLGEDQVQGEAHVDVAVTADEQVLGRRSCTPGWSWRRSRFRCRCLVSTPTVRPPADGELAP